MGFSRTQPASVLLVIALLFACLAAQAQAWQRARATWYDDAAWMSVHSGSCMYGYLGNRFGGQNNWHVAAINDGNSRYAGSCGRCFQMKCVPGGFKDALGNYIDRYSDCKSQAPVTIAITDTCPCHKPNNLYSNKRWCCGDMEHFDVGIWAFRKMADPGKGVILIDYQPVTCPSDFNVRLNPGVQNPDSLLAQYPWDLANQQTPSQKKVSAFNGPSSG